MTRTRAPGLEFHFTVAKSDGMVISARRFESHNVRSRKSAVRKVLQHRNVSMTLKHLVSRD